MLAYVACSGGEYRYTAGMLSPVELDLLTWMIALVVRAATRLGPAGGPWEEEETLALTERFDDGFMENVAPCLPPVLRNVVCRFRTGQRVVGHRGLRLACEGRVSSPRLVLICAGFLYVDGEETSLMMGSATVRRMTNSDRH